MNQHHVTNQLLAINGERLFTETGWQKVVSPRINVMPCDGGCICIVLDAQPNHRNFLTVSVASFTGPERKALRKAIIKSREKAREVPSQP